MKLEPRSYYPAVLFGPKPGQLIQLEGEEHIRCDDGVYYPVDLVASKVHLFGGRPVYEYHHNFPNPKPLEIGRVIHVIWDGKRREVQGIVEIHNPLWQRHLEALRVDDLPGLSPVFFNIGRGGRPIRLIEAIHEVVSLDICDEPLSGARFLPLADGVKIMLHKEAELLQKRYGPKGYFKPLQAPQDLSSEFLAYPPEGKGQIQSERIQEPVGFFKGPSGRVVRVRD